MTERESTHLAHQQLPPLARDRGFWGMTATQFLGAFNDNLFKQMILLLCVDYANRHPGSGDQQGIAQGLFALPFVLCSGFGGYLSDRSSKRTIIVLCKVAEIAVMLAGVAALLLVQSSGLDFAGGTPAAQWGNGLWPLFIVLFFMGTQSAFFGPSKYGILPEMLRQRDLPAGNGVIQMTTFVAIIFGTAAAGYGKELFAGRLWIITAICVAIAIAGTLTSLFVRKTPVAQPGLKFEYSSLGIHAQTRKLLRRDRPLLGVLLVSSLFWFVGGLVLPAVNALGKGKLEMNLKDARTSLLATCMGVGIAIGCVAAGKLSKKRLRFEFVTVGAWGMVICLAAGTVVGTVLAPPGARSGKAMKDGRWKMEDGRWKMEDGRWKMEDGGWRMEDGTAPFFDPPSSILHPPAQAAPPESFTELLIPKTTQEALLRITLTGLGLFAGLFVVPLQVFLQARPPEDQKGRMIGAMNLLNWIGILLAAGFYALATYSFNKLQLSISWIFAVTSLLLLPVALLYRPREETLE